MNVGAKARSPPMTNHACSPTYTYDKGIPTIQRNRAGAAERKFTAPAATRTPGSPRRSSGIAPPRPAPSHPCGGAGRGVRAPAPAWRCARRAAGYRCAPRRAAAGSPSQRREALDHPAVRRDLQRRDALDRGPAHVDVGVQTHLRWRRQVVAQHQVAVRRRRDRVVTPRHGDNAVGARALPRRTKIQAALRHDGVGRDDRVRPRHVDQRGDGHAAPRAPCPAGTRRPARRSVPSYRPRPGRPRRRRRAPRRAR